MKLRILIGGMLVVLSMAASADTLYRWVDSQGNVHFTDQPPAPKAAKKVDEIRLPKSTPSDPQVPFVLQQAMKNHPVTLYVAAKCAPCEDARALLGKRGIPYAEKDPQKDIAVAEELKKLAGDLTVPMLVVGKAAPLKGFEAGQWTEALDVAGYPKTGAPLRPARKVEPVVQEKPPASGEPPQPSTEATGRQP